MGRNAQPIDLLMAKGKKHLTKAEIEHRKNSEISFGEKKLKCPDFVKDDVAAYKKWKEIQRIYNDVDFVSSGDVGLLARYCKTFSEYQSLIDHRKRIDNIDSFTPEETDIALEEFSERLGEKKAKDLFLKINYIISVGGVLQIETAINKKMDMLIKMEDRLFLNPLAKIKNVPKKEKQKDQDPNASMFGD